MVYSHIGIYATMRINDLQLHETIPKYLNLTLNEKPSHEGVFNLHKLHNYAKIMMWEASKVVKVELLLKGAQVRSSEVLVRFLFLYLDASYRGSICEVFPEHYVHTHTHLNSMCKMPLFPMDLYARVL